MSPSETTLARMHRVKEKNIPSKPVPAKKEFSLISDQKLVKLYTTMVQCRMLEQRATSLFEQGKLADDLRASADREAAAAAVAINLLRTDALSLSIGDFAPAFVQGLPLEQIFKQLGHKFELNGTASATHSQYQVLNIFFPVLTLRDQLDRVVEVARALGTNKKSSIAVAFFEADRSTANAVHCALKSAGTENLPILFVSHGHVERAKRKPNSSIKTAAPDALLNGVPTIVVDASDVVAIYRVVTEAMARARQGRGPTLLECVPVLPSAPTVNATIEDRIKDMDSKKHRDCSDVVDCISKMETYLQRKGLFSENLKRRIVTHFNAKLELATRLLND